MPAAVLDPPSVAGPPAPASVSGTIVRRTSPDRVVLGGANWEVYDRLRKAPENDGFKITYDGPLGLLEIEMSEGPLHASTSRTLALLIATFGLNREIDLRSTGNVTLRRRDLDRGLEADETFYIHSLTEAPDLTANVLDLNAGAPPDVAVEVDVTRPGLSKLPIYAALGVSEVWVWRDDALTVHRLTEGGNEVVDESEEPPGFPVAAAARLLRDRGDRSDVRLVREFTTQLGADG